MSRPIVFLDDGGVINDNARRGEQWPALVAAFFAPLLGGTPQAWAAANVRVVRAQLAPATLQARRSAARDYASVARQDHIDWLAGMCAEVGLPRLPEDECVALARRASAWIIPQVRAAYPGAVEAIRRLHARGYTLHTASSGPSDELAGHLAGLGIRSCFGRLYGPDLIDTFKDGPPFYERLLRDAGVAPYDALIVDDSPQALEWAARAGTQTVRVGAAHPATGKQPSIASLAELPPLLARWGRVEGKGIR